MRNRSYTWQKRSSSWLYLLVWLSVLLGSQYGFGQANVPLGSWQVHVPYQQGRAVADAGDKVYVAAERGLFYYDKEFNTTETITKVDGLREQQISSIAYDKATQTLVIAYANTNIDLLQGSKVINISDVFRKAIPGEKSIHAITIHDKQAYLASSFGVVVLDLVKREVKDTYSNLGPGGEAVRVRATAILRDSIYLATDPGVLAAQRSGYNLQDFRSWSNLSTALPAAPTGLAVFNGRLYASTADNIYTLSGGSWRNTALVEATTINSIHASEKHLAVATASGISLWHQNGTVSRLSHQLLTDPRQATVGAEGTVWVADGKKGLVKMRPDGTQAEAVSPDGPYTSNSFRVYAHGGKVYVLSGGYNENYVPNNLRDGFYTYAGGEWQSYNQELYPGAAFTQAKDLVDATYNPVTEKLYLASYGNGLVEWEQLGKGQLYNGTNSPLLSTLGGADKAEEVRLTDVAVDPEGNVWVVNRNQLANEPGLHMLRPDGNWESFLLPGVADGSNLEHLLLDDAGHKWLSIARSGNRRSGLVAFDDKENRVRYLSTGEGNGDLPNGAVYAMAKDLNGDIWVGTASGVGVYYNPAFVFESQVYDARKPIIDRRPLLDGQLVRAIAVDGANRKWMGTDNGLWLFSADGDELLRHFTTRNSPLPSDRVLSVAVEHETGNVFVATDAGVASYRAEATVTEGEPACAVVFPNPVQRDYTGLIGVSGLPNNADVRITDVAGTLVYKAKATGGTLAWDARDYNGNRVKAGVYLVMSSGGESGQTCISKIAVLD